MTTEIQVLDTDSTIELLLTATEAVSEAQRIYDEALEKYEKRLTTISILALDTPTFKTDKLDTDGNIVLRKPSNDMERKQAIAQATKNSTGLVKLRRQVKEAKRILIDWRSREKNYRLIIQYRSQAFNQFVD